MWLLALVLPLQGTAAGVFGVLGQSHIHRSAQRAPATLVLEDVRRWKAPVAEAPAHVLTGIGHFHAGAAPQRHRHAQGDDSVVALKGEPVDGDEAPGFDIVSGLALLPAVTVWSSAARGSAHGAWRPWAARCVSVEPFERPPRRA
jgi:hypothetical protein